MASRARIGRWILAITFLLVVAVAAGTAPPEDVTYQGRLLDSSGDPLAGPVNIEIGIWDQPTGGTQLYGETHSGVALVDGVFNILLGTGTVVVGSFDADLFAAQNRYLEVTVEGEALTPRQPFSSVAYSLRSAESEGATYADTAGDADTLDGRDAASLDQSGHAADTGNPHNVTAAQVGAITLADGEAHAADPSAHHVKTTTFGELTGQAADAQIPSSIARDSEITWGNLAGIPGDFADGVDNTGITSESDPQVGSNTTNRVPKWNGSSLVAGSIQDDGNLSITDARFTVSSSVDLPPLAVGVFAATDTSSAGEYAVYGESDNGTGVSGQSTGGTGVVGYGANIGVRGSTSWSGTGVYGEFSSTPLTPGPGYGVRGYASGGSDSYAVYGRHYYGGFGYLGGTDYAVYGESDDAEGYAGGFRGNVVIMSQASGAAVVELGEGLDYAEGFDVSDTEDIQPGSVLVIDPDSPGKLTISKTAYDTKVAGIVTGAEDLGPGVRLGVDQFDRDVALAGRVFCRVDATESAVQPGDLLTTSSTPGHAMKAVDHARARGAILGKAMQGLEKGQKGQVLVLVSLQ